MKELPELSINRENIIISNYEEFTRNKGNNLLSLKISSKSPSLETIRLLNSHNGDVKILPFNYDIESFNELLHCLSNTVNNYIEIKLFKNAINYKKNKHISF